VNEMKAPTFPGFTAEVALFNTSQSYRMAGTPGSLAGGVVPQLALGDLIGGGWCWLKYAGCLFWCLIKHPGGPGDDILRIACAVNCRAGYTLCKLTQSLNSL
jgi:hypothetical protein